MIVFANRFATPPGGEYFFEYEGDSFRTRSFSDAITKTERILKKHGIHTYPEHALASFMCPHLPDGFCSQNFGNKVFTLEKQKNTAMQYFDLPVTTFDVIGHRLDQCVRCPRHSRTFCLTCVGAVSWIRQMFRGARRMLPIDNYTGTCLCAGTFESVVASIEKDKLPKWDEQPPPNCWRNQ